MDKKLFTTEKSKFLITVKIKQQKSILLSPEVYFNHYINM